MKQTTDLYIIGIYFFPKSGNTRMRAILGNAVDRPDGRAALDVVPDIYKTPIWNAPVIIAGCATILYKSHGKTAPPAAYGRKISNDLVVYVIRHPLDVFLSLLNYVSANVMPNPNITLLCASVDAVIAQGQLDLYFGAFCVFGTLQQQFVDVGSWFINAENWLAGAAAEPDRVLVVRYEHMLTQSPASLSVVASKIGLTPQQIEVGFKTAAEQTKPDGRLFWKQKAGHFRDILPQSLIDCFHEQHCDRVRALGYS